MINKVSEIWSKVADIQNEGITLSELFQGHILNEDVVSVSVLLSHNTLHKASACLTILLTFYDTNEAGNTLCTVCYNKNYGTRKYILNYVINMLHVFDHKDEHIA